MPTSRLLSEDQLICAKCTSLTSRVIICSHCNDSLPLCLTFTPNKRLIRTESLYQHHTGPQTKIEVEATLHETQIQLQKYDHLISQLTSSRLQISLSISYHKSRIAPIKRLPLELLATIFSLVVHSSSDIGGNHIFLGQLPTLHLSHVSTSWRRLVWASPSLWTRINVTSPSHRSYRRLMRSRKPPPNPNPEASRLEILNLFLTLSRTHPLYVKFFLFWRPRGGNELAKALCEHSNRWKEFEVGASDVLLLTLPMASSIRGRMKMLEKLTLTGYKAIEEAPLHLFDQAPRLIEVSLGQQRLDRFPLPKETIRTLKLDGVRPSELVDLPSLSPNLNHLSLHETYVLEDEGSLGPGSLYLPELQSLNIQGRGTVYPFLVALSVPELKDISIEDVDFTQEVQYHSTPTAGSLKFDADILGPVNTGPAHSLSHVDLTSLTLNGLYITQEQLIGTLSCLPHLLHLTLMRLSYRVDRPQNEGGNDDDIYGDDYPIFLHTCSSYFFKLLTPSPYPSAIHTLPPTLQSLRIESRDPIIDESIMRCFISFHLTPSSPCSPRSSLKWLELVFTNKSFSTPMVHWLKTTPFFPPHPVGHSMWDGWGSNEFGMNGHHPSDNIDNIFITNGERESVGNMGLRVRHQVVLGSKRYGAFVRSF